MSHLFSKRIQDGALLEDEVVPGSRIEIYLTWSNIELSMRGGGWFDGTVLTAPDSDTGAFTVSAGENAPIPNKVYTCSMIEEGYGRVSWRFKEAA